MAPWHNRYMAALVIVFAFYLEGCARQPGAASDRGARTDPSPGPLMPAAATVAPGDELALLRNLRAGAHRTSVTIRVTVDGQALPGAELDFAADGVPAGVLVAHGRAETADGGRLLDFAAQARDGQLRYKTSALEEWVEEPFRGVRQVYNMVGAIDDIGLLLAAADSGVARAAGHDGAAGALRFAADAAGLALLLEAREDIQAEVLEADFSIARKGPREALVASRLVLAVGAERVEMDVTSTITGLDRAPEQVQV